VSVLRETGHRHEHARRLLALSLHQGEPTGSGFGLHQRAQSDPVIDHIAHVDANALSADNFRAQQTLLLC
jgi:hypothetical protein